MTENTNLPFDMSNIEIKKYKPKTIKKVNKRNNENYKTEIKRMGKINPNGFESKLIKLMGEKKRKN